MDEPNKPYPSREEDAALVAKAQAGDIAARTELVNRHVRFIWKMASNFARKRRNCRPEDVVGAATEAFIKAIEKFDTSYGTRLTTYAGRGCINTMNRYWFHATQIVRVPATALLEDSTREKAQRALCNIQQADDATRGMPVYIHNDAADEDRERELQYAREAMAELDLRTQEVIALRLDGAILAKIGAKFGITKERARQIEEAGYIKIRKAVARRMKDEQTTNEPAE